MPTGLKIALAGFASVLLGIGLLGGATAVLIFGGVATIFIGIVWFIEVDG